MKSAYELAMARLGGPLHKYTDEQKKALAEIDSLFESRVAQAKIDADSRLRKAEKDAEVDKVREDLAAELARIEQERERKKEALRGKFGG